MKIVLLVIAIFFLFKYFKSRYQFIQLKDRLKFYLLKIDLEIHENPENALHFCRRGSLYMQMQNFPKANADFRHANELIEKGFQITEKDKFSERLKSNISFTQKPLPWSKNGPKNLSKSTLTFFLIERFGNIRYQF